MVGATVVVVEVVVVDDVEVVEGEVVDVNGEVVAGRVEEVSTLDGDSASAAEQATSTAADTAGSTSRGREGNLAGADLTGWSRYRPGCDECWRVSRTPM